MEDFKKTATNRMTNTALSEQPLTDPPTADGGDKNPEELMATAARRETRKLGPESTLVETSLRRSKINDNI